MLDKTRSRLKDQEWTFTPPPDDGNYSIEIATLACLMDIRDELKQLNGLLHCPGFMAIPYKLDRIARNTTKTRRKRK